MSRQVLGQRRAGRRLARDVGPALLDAHFEHRHQVRMVQPGSGLCRLLPAFEGLCIGRLLARQADHQLEPGPLVIAQPVHRARALAEQATQFEPPESACGQ
jgi:hypothetical protein